MVETTRPAKAKRMAGAAGGAAGRGLLLRSLVPLGHLLVWLFGVRKAGLRWYDPLLWLIYPLFYLGFIVIRGKWSGFIPIPSLMLVLWDMRARR